MTLRQPVEAAVPGLARDREIKVRPSLLAQEIGRRFLRVRALITFRCAP